MIKQSLSNTIPGNIFDEKDFYDIGETFKELDKIDITNLISSLGTPNLTMWVPLLG